MQTKIGVQRYRETMIKRFGSEKAWKDNMRMNAAKGGRATRGYGFAHGKIDPKDASLLGTSKRWGNGK